MALDRVLTEVRDLRAEVEHRVAERTTELVAANGSLELEVVKNRRLTELLMLRNRDLMASINYARRIQDAIFPSMADVQFFKDRASLALPRDVVSGDFMWHYETAEHVFFAVADCTGHGVPGALMSMLGNSLLNQMFVDRRLTDPEEVLQRMDRTLTQLFTRYQADERMHDGMDIGCLALEKASLKLHYSGALMKAIVMRGEEMIQLECARWAVGGHAGQVMKRFQCEELQLQQGDRIVLSTDGYYSQFGGPRNKKMTSHVFRDLLRYTADLPAEATVSFLERRFEEWMGGDQEQIDDVLVVVLDL
jgi:two-component system, sensor histidine kinase LadS